MVQGNQYIKNKSKTSFSEIYILCALVILILLFLITGLGKVFNHSAFVSQLNKQPLQIWSIPLLTYFLPILELGTVTLMCIPKMRMWGLALSFLLITIYTIYAYLAYIEIYGYIPCACGKVFDKMDWQQHFFFNLGITLIAAPALFLEYRLKKKLCIANFDGSSTSRKNSL